MIYILFSCNIWKESNSMSLVTASISVEKIRDIIINEMKKGNMDYSGRCDEAAPIIDQISTFCEDYYDESPEFAFDHIKYGYVQKIEDREVL